MKEVFVITKVQKILCNDPKCACQSSFTLERVSEPLGSYKEAEEAIKKEPPGEYQIQKLFVRGEG